MSGYPSLLLPALADVLSQTYLRAGALVFGGVLVALALTRRRE